MSVARYCSWSFPIHQKQKTKNKGKGLESSAVVLRLSSAKTAILEDSETILLPKLFFLQQANLQTAGNNVEDCCYCGNSHYCRIYSQVLRKMKSAIKKQAEDPEFGALCRREKHPVLTVY